MASSANVKLKWQTDAFEDDPLGAEGPVVGGIYRDGLDRSFAVLSISGSAALLEYADGSVASVTLRDWHRLHPRSAVY